MTPEQAALLKKAEASLAAARGLLADGYPDFSASRAYYTLFYLAEALLLSENLTFSKHAGVMRRSANISSKPARLRKTSTDI